MSIPCDCDLWEHERWTNDDQEKMTTGRIELFKMRVAVSKQLLRSCTKSKLISAKIKLQFEPEKVHVHHVRFHLLNWGKIFSKTKSSHWFKDSKMDSHVGSITNCNS